MGNRYGARADEFAWTLGVLRRLKRYIQSGLSYSECGKLLGCSRNSIAHGVRKLNAPLLNAEERRERTRRTRFEDAIHGRRSRNKIAEDYTYIESWREFTERRQKERAALREEPPSS